MSVKMVNMGADQQTFSAVLNTEVRKSSTVSGAFFQGHCWVIKERISGKSTLVCSFSIASNGGEGTDSRLDAESGGH